jgi:phosphate/sulfate permease
MTVLVASRLKIPASTTHCVVGSVFAVGLADGIKAVNWRYVPSPPQALLQTAALGTHGFVVGYC